MSVFLQGTEHPVNAFVKFPLTFQVWGQVCFLVSAQRAHASKPIVICEDVEGDIQGNIHHVKISEQIISRT